VTRNFPSWLDAYAEFAGHTEAPRLMHRWAGVWALAGVLRKRVWMDQIAFKWVPNFFIIFVAPPGIVSKSTTAGLAESFLREIPGIKFGPDIVTWPSLVTSFAAACESFEFEGEYIPMSPLNLIASEFGNLVDPNDKAMVNLFIDLWDGRKTLEKQTKMSGNDIVEGPWINMLGCTTPHWIADNMPASTIGGGFTSRCIFVYAENKERLIPYPKFSFPGDAKVIRQKLLQDLEHIALTLCGEYSLDPEARKWGESWYELHWGNALSSFQDDRLEGYIARKQTHLHKLAMVLAASRRDSLVVMMEDLVDADEMLQQTEADLLRVFARIGQSEASMQSDRLVLQIQRAGRLSYNEVYRTLRSAFPDARDSSAIVEGLVKAGLIAIQSTPKGLYLVYTEVPDGAA
jgi:hypothetical protein